MKIRMLRSENGSVDGVRVRPYIAGEEHDLTGSPGERSLALAFVGAHLAEEVVTRAPDLQQKAAPAPDNKALSSPAENKRRKGKQA